ncbi:MAG: MATE family efflux transporter [Planctomycetia bacterium]|nr:MATE family efflux transporter [Planctomycetia bacterium]
MELVYTQEETCHAPDPEKEVLLLKTIPETRGQLCSILFWLLLPLFLEQILILGVTFSDYILTGKFLQKEHIAAMTSSGYITWLMQSIYCFISVGVTAMVARFCGQRDPVLASKVLNQAYFIGAVFTVVFFAFLWFYLDQMVDLLRLQSSADQYAREYLWIILPSLPFLMLSAIGMSALRGAGNMAIGLWIMVLINVVNIFVSWGLVLGIGPLPCLGWKGVAAGTTLGFIIGGVATTLVLWRGSYGLKLKFRQMVPDMNMIGRILWISIPSGLDIMTIIGCQLWFVGLINKLGVEASAAHGIALRVESLGFAPLAAFQMVVMTLVGQFLGARRTDLAVRISYYTLGIALSFIFVVSTIFFIGADILPFIFLKNDSAYLAAAAAPLLRVISIALPFFTVTVVFSGVLRGAGDTRCPLVISFFGFLFVRILCTYYFSFSEINLGSWVIHGMNWGVVGAWIAMAADIIVRCFLLSARFWYGKWKRIEV